MLFAWRRQPLRPMPEIDFSIFSTASCSTAGGEKASSGRFRNGAITGETTKENPTDGNTFLIFSGKVVDFKQRLKVKILRAIAPS
jgi:hypothetical protein